MPIQTQSAAVRKVGAELQKERAEVAIHAVKIIVIHQCRGLDDPGVADSRTRVPPLLGPVDSALFLRLADEQDALLSLEASEEPGRNVILALPFSKFVTEMSFSATKRSIARTKARIIGSAIAVEATLCPRYRRINPSTPLTVCSLGTYTFKYIRSIPSSSSTTWSRSTSATLCATPGFIFSVGLPRMPQL